MTLILLGKLAGMTTPEAIAQWVQLRAEWLKQVFPMPPERVPCASTYRTILPVLDAAHVNQVLAQLLSRAAAAKRCAEESSRLVGQAEREAQVHVALDGKPLRGTLGHLAADQQKRHQVGLYETRTGVVLKEQVVADKENELSRVVEFLVPLWVKGRIISADALHTQHTFSTSVTVAGGDSLLFAKGNHPT